MPVTVSYPGVYVQEEASGARAIGGVATSVAMFVGMAKLGPLNVPTRVLSFADFERAFGSDTGGELADQVRQFYINGGGQAWICRIADDTAARADVTLKDEQGNSCLTVTARDHGQEGNLIRVEVDYDTASPERTFNLSVLRSRLQDDGTFSRDDEETYKGLSMDPASTTYVESVVNGTSALITVATDRTNVPTGAGMSISGQVFRVADPDAFADIDALVGPTNAFRVGVDNNPPVTCVFAAGADLTATLNNIQDAIVNAYGSVSVTVAVVMLAAGAATAVDGGRLLRISSATGPVVISPAATNDVSGALMLGVASGGLEGNEHGDIRPAPSGLVGRNGSSADDFAVLRSLVGEDRNNITGFQLSDDSGDPTHTAPIALPGTARLYDDGTTQTLGNVRDLLDIMADVLSTNTNERWSTRRHGLRLSLSASYGSHDTGLAAALTTSGGYDIGAAGEPFEDAAPGSIDAYNVAAYKLGQSGGIGGDGPFQNGPGATAGNDGLAPQPHNYDNAYNVIEEQVDLFNLMILPRADGQIDDDRAALWGAASAFCAKQRAFLLVDPQGWSMIAEAESGVDQLRVGVETKNAAAFWPRLKIADGSANGRPIDPSGSMAGLMARIDANRGVWKAAAGLEATIRGVMGVEHRMSDPQNGIINPKALNAIRLFPAGVVSWGARTLVGFNGSGNVDDKYVPVRRTMLFIEESLYRGLRFAVFEPNGESLWAQIRLAVDSFMSGLFRQGAFAGQKAPDAYFIVCDSTTTTPTDINLGIVNVIVGFAPLKPAEFVVLTVKQIAGQVSV